MKFSCSLLHRPWLSQSRLGFTLLEVLVAATIFSIIGVLATTIFINVSRDRQRITSRNLLYDDAQFILDALSRQITGNAIDYEEYYNQLVLGGNPGMNYGHYATSFYLNKEKVADGCVYLSKNGVKTPCINLGKNGTNENAFFKSGASNPPGGIFCGDGGIFPGFLGDPFKPLFTESKNFACVNRLFLIDSSGKQKTMIAPELIDWSSLYKKSGGSISHVLSQAVMVNKVGADGTLLPGIFTCHTSFPCDQKNTVTGINGAPNVEVWYPNNKDLETNLGEAKNEKGTDQEIIANAYTSDFIPFTPSRVNIKNISFYISPVEDPHKAFDEANESTGAPTNIHQPKVTIILEVEPISNVKYGTGFPSLSVQTTVTPGVFSEVVSYPPQMEKQP